MPVLPISVTAETFGDDLRDTLRRTRSAGFEGVLVRARTPALDLTALSATGQREVRHLLSGARLGLVGLQLDLPREGFGPKADLDRLLARLSDAAGAAVGLGAPMVCVDLGPLPPAPAEPAAVRPPVSPSQAGLILLPEPVAEPSPAPPAPREPAFEASVGAALRELGTIADRHGVTFALRSSLAPFAALDRALKAAACPWFGVDLDPVAILADETWDADAVLSRLGHAVRHVRGRDARVGAGRRVQPAPLGTGDVQWPAFLAGLDAAGYRSFVSVDPLDLPDRPASALAGLAALRGAAPR